MYGVLTKIFNIIRKFHEGFIAHFVHNFRLTDKDVCSPPSVSYRPRLVDESGVWIIR